MSDRLRVIGFVQKPLGVSPGQRFRFEQWAPHLRSKHGIDVDFVPFESDRLTEILYTRGDVAAKGALMVKDFARRAGAVRRARSYDAAIVYREVSSLGPAVWERVLAQLRVPFLVDFDDAIWMSAAEGPKSINGVFSRLRFPGKIKSICRVAQGVTVGNEFLATWARQHNPNVHVVPTSIDLDLYPVQPPLAGEDPFVIGWMGSHSTLINLEHVRAAVEQFGLRRKTRFIVVCDRPLEPGFANVENVFVKWTATGEAKDIGAMHAGVMPLIDFPFAWGKCGCKALQYMAAGRPAIASPIGVNTDIILHGENGLLASTTQEWLDALEHVATSRELRQALAVAGRATVEAGYSAEASAARFAGAVLTLVTSDAGARGARRDRRPASPRTTPPA